VTWTPAGRGLILDAGGFIRPARNSKRASGGFLRFLVEAANLDGCRPAARTPGRFRLSTGRDTSAGGSRLSARDLDGPRPAGRVTDSGGSRRPARGVPFILDAGWAGLTRPVASSDPESSRTIAGGVPMGPA